MARWTAGIVALWALLGTARAETVRYMHPHPMPAGVVKGMCHIEGSHIHSFKPHEPLLYVEVEGQYAFIGDHTEFAPEEPKHAYYGHHPVFWVGDEGGEPQHYCYITGPHYHLYAPPAQLKFTTRGGAYWFVGAHPGWYRKRHRRYRAVDRHYAHVHITRPVVTVEPPEGFVGIYIGPRGRARVHGGVGLGVHVVPPPPGIDVNIHLPGVGVVFGGGPRGRGVAHPHPVYKKKRGKAWGKAWGHRKIKVKRKGKWK